jgi:poly-gamma-glutamate capsule biosynthesis protein CapA/YwtB (metallophosphatase superfamily)
MFRVIYSLFFFNLLFSDIIYENGELSKFFGGDAPSSSYSNWLSHVTEGVAEPNYNDYGPDFIDVQTNGFGSYKKLSENSPTLLYWENIFQKFITGDLESTDSLLQDSIETFYYNLIVFNDTIENKTYHILRESLDTSFNDLNQPEIDFDDVMGSFRNSWGLYIINPTAQREQVVIQVPHPCDDFIAPYIALDIFIKTDALGFMISSAGREVEWSENGSYANSKSYSDPSRYSFTVFQKFQEAITQPLFNSGPHSPLVLAVHSFDNESHLERNSIILAAGGEKPSTTKPIRDISNDKFDFINFTDEFPIIENQFGIHNPTHVTDYYEVFYDDLFLYNNGNEDFEITLATELKGPSNGVQMIDLQSKVSSYSVYESWVHIELDEKPMLFDSLGISDDDLYLNGFYPTGIQNFSKIRDYYQPFVDALNTYLIHWDESIDQEIPDRVHLSYIENQDNPEYVRLQWAPVYDTNFKTYQIEASTDSLMINSISFDFENFERLQYMKQNNQIINILDNTETWYFRMRAKDYFGNTGLWSETRINRLPGHSLPDTILSFDQNTVVHSYPEQDYDSLKYNIDDGILMPGDSPTFCLYGNTWKSIFIEPIQIDSSMVIQLFAKIDSISEMQGLSIGSGDNSIQYAFAGNEILDIDEWIPVYQGLFEINTWNSYRLPIGDDWLAKYDSLDVITKISFINNHDDTSTSPGSIHYSMIRNFTSDLPIPPNVIIETNTETLNSSINREIFPVSFLSVVEDLDSYTFLYYWDFGDGNYSTLSNPTHEYIFQENQEFDVLLTVTDETGLQGWGSTSIIIDSLEHYTSEISMNFVGDIMLGRRFEEAEGIITNQGVNALFEPTHQILGLAADITIANLEIPLTNQGTPHPTKGIVFRSSPNNISGLIYAGIDVVSLANNHILDFMEPGLIQTQNVLTQAGIKFSGAGINSNEAYLPAFKSLKGQTIAFLASSDRTGQYNNYQPFLNAGENKSGFAYMTPYYLRKQIKAVEDFADLIVLELHAGSEYSYEPGSNYDYHGSNNDFGSIRYNPASNLGFETIEFEEEDYSWRLDQPKMWDRSIRQFAIDEGADLIIVHHPHIIQGLEVYNGKLIAHSLGNFIFDLNYPETYPSIILNSKSNETGFIEYSILPLYIDDYLTKPAKGELANYILDHLAMQSKKLDTYLHVDTDNHIAHVILDTFLLQRESLLYNTSINSSKTVDINGSNYFKSNPILVSKAGSLSGILGSNHAISHYRLGREKIWMNNFEDEGSSLWNLNSENETVQDTIFRRGHYAVSHKRDYQSPVNLVTNLEERIPIKSNLNHSLHGYIKTMNGKNVTLELRSSINRTGESLFTTSILDSVSGDTRWTKYWGDIPLTENSEFVDIRMNSSIPDSGDAFSWFDDIGLIEWDSLKTLTSFPVNLESPNNYDYIQVYYLVLPEEILTINLKNTIIGTLSELESKPKAVNPVITVPDVFYFYDDSEGPVGNRSWTVNDNINMNSDNPYFLCEEPGVYEVKLSITGLNQQIKEKSITVIALEEGIILNDMGDVNGDGNITLLDALICSNSILSYYELTPEEFLTSDMDKNGIINIFDTLLILDLIN